MPCCLSCFIYLETSNGYTDLLKTAVENRDARALHILLDHLYALSNQGYKKVLRYELVLTELRMSELLADQKWIDIEEVVRKLHELNGQGAFSAVLDRFSFPMSSTSSDTKGCAT